MRMLFDVWATASIFTMQRTHAHALFLHVLIDELLPALHEHTRVDRDAAATNVRPSAKNTASAPGRPCDATKAFAAIAVFGKNANASKLPHSGPASAAVEIIKERGI